jgi:UPF0755 protein
MVKKQPLSFVELHKKKIRIAYVFLLCVVSCISSGALYVIETKKVVFDEAIVRTDPAEIERLKVPEVEAFPIGVNPTKQLITENDTVDTFFNTHISSNAKKESKVSWVQTHILSKLAKLDWYQNLASPISRILVIDSGERKEEVVNNLGGILRWDQSERRLFTTRIASTSPELIDGKFFPGRYVVDKDASPEAVADVITERFRTNVSERYTKDIEKIIPLVDTLTLASLLEREAYDFEDMRLISGIIWNRLFADMKLQLDASLQYAKANKGGAEWWPVPTPSDKNIKSPFNTYQNKGLPPSPIANPSPEAILAALNPKQTNCIFYFHDKDGGFHCTETYQEHVTLIKQYYKKSN